jgi:hypothetical protein
MTALVLHTAKVAWRGSSALTATQAGTSGTTWTISPSLTLGEDDGGCPRTICAGIPIRGWGFESLRVRQPWSGP